MNHPYNYSPRVTNDNDDNARVDEEGAEEDDFKVHGPDSDTPGKDDEEELGGEFDPDLEFEEEEEEE